MTTLASINVDGKAFNLYSAPSSFDNPAVWRYEDANIAPLYRPTIKQEANPNAAGTNINSRVTTRVPVVTTVNGVASVTNTVKAVTDFTSLQVLVSSDSLTLAIEAQIAALTALKANIIAGKTI